MADTVTALREELAAERRARLAAEQESRRRRAEFRRLLIRLGIDPDTSIAPLMAAEHIRRERDELRTRVDELELLLEHAEQYARDLQDGGMS